MVRLRAHWNVSLRGLQWQYKTQDKNRLHSRNRSIFFSGRKQALYQQIDHRTLNCFEHASIYSPSIRSPSWERKRIRFNGDRSPVRFYTFYETSDHSSNLERDHTRAMNELAGLETFVSFLFFVFVSSCLCTKLK